VFVDTFAGRAGSFLQHGVAAIGFHLRHRLGVVRTDQRASRVAPPVPRGPAMDPELLRRLAEVARTVGMLEWSRRYAEIIAHPEAAGSSVKT
jgi:hypothetical protein